MSLKEASYCTSVDPITYPVLSVPLVLEPWKVLFLGIKWPDYPRTV